LYILLFFVILRKLYQATKLENYLDMPYFLRLIFARFAEKGKNYVFARVRRGLFCPFVAHKKPRPKAWLQLYLSLISFGLLGLTPTRFRICRRAFLRA
jgi:hypothetical protein